MTSTLIPAPGIMLPTVTPWHHESLGGDLATGSIGNIAGSSTAWPASSLALFVPFVLAAPVSIGQAFTSNGASTGDSIDLGIYTSDFRRLVSTALQAQSGTSALQVFGLTTTQFGPGRFFMAISVNGTTSTLIARAPTAAFMRAMGCFQQDLSGAGTPGTLPATATPAAVANAYLPVFGLGRAGFTF